MKWDRWLCTVCEVGWEENVDEADACEGKMSTI